MRRLQAASVVAYFAKAGRCGIARTIAADWLRPGCLEVPLSYPVTTELPFDGRDYAGSWAPSTRDAAERLALHLEAGRDVALLCEGDPLFYGSFMHLHSRLKGRFAVEIVPGVTGMSGCWTAAGGR